MGSPLTAASPESPARPAGSPGATTDLVEAYRATRSLTEALAAPLTAEDQSIQSMPDVSPTKWHRAHVTWFFETFLLECFAADHSPFDPRYRELFNSYYEGVGPQFPRAQRGLLSRPGVDEISSYRAAVDASMEELLASELGGDGSAVADLTVLGLHHEQQHQELLLMDIKHVLSINPLQPVYRPERTHPRAATPLGWLDVDGGLSEFGWAGSGFSFDNESPRHCAYLYPYRLADRLVTAGEWRAFIDDGGYRRADLWLSDGWHAVRSQGWAAPLYWVPERDGWSVHTLAGTRPLDPDEPVCHVSYYEADAYARWAGKRLPTELEWERALSLGFSSRPFDLDALQPRAAAVQDEAPQVRQAFGECWQWTASAYLPYPGFEPAAGAVGEYNGKFMSGQMVLRGSSSYTPPSHARPTYRNFFPPHARWMVSGVRLADGGTP